MMVMMIDGNDERLQKLARGKQERPLPRRFYKTVSVSADNGILLDRRPVKTPLKASLVLPNAALAEAVAAEWQAQDTHINAGLMPLTKLANTAIDRATQERAAVISEIVAYAGNDLVCYWADKPAALVERQRQHWQPVLDWAEQKFGTGFTVAHGISHVAQPEAALAAVRRFGEGFDPWHLTVLFLLTTMTGSMLLSAQLIEGGVAPDAVWAAAHVDEDYQIEEWGLDCEAEQRRDARKQEFGGLVRFFGLL